MYLSLQVQLLIPGPVDIHVACHMIIHMMTYTCSSIDALADVYIMAHLHHCSVLFKDNVALTHV